MTIHFQKARKTLPYRVLSAFIAFTFSFSYIVPPVPVYGQGIPATVMSLPVPGTPVPLTLGFTPARIIGMTIHADNPLMFDFMVDPGDTGLDVGNGRDRSLQEESEQLIKYFLASLTVPAEKLWVNLSPYEKDKIVPEEFGLTEMGTELLAQDYMLKQLTASLMNPEDEVGKKFWDRVYEKAQKLFGTTEIPMNTFNKVWIVPEKAVVYVNGLNVFVLESRFKVMLEEDYLALEHHNAESPDPKADVVSGVSSSVIKEVLLPEIEKEVNEGKTFAKLRQIQNSLILATWYKQNLKESLLGQIYADKAKTGGLTVEDREMSRKIYEQYVEAFKKGVHNFIKEDYDPATKQIIPRKYFSGGVAANETKVEEASLPLRKDMKKFSKELARSKNITARVESTKGEISPDMTFVPGKKGKTSSTVGGDGTRKMKITKLIQKLSDLDPDSRLWAARALGKIGGPKAVRVNALKEALFRRDPDPHVRLAVVRALGEIGGPKAFSVLTEALDYFDTDVCLQAAWALWKIDGSKAFSIFMEALRDRRTSRNVRRAAAWALGEIGVPKALSVLMEALNDDDIRHTADIALGNIGDLKAVSALTKVAEDDPYPDVKSVAAKAIEKIKAKQSAASPVEITVDKLENMVMESGEKETISFKESTLQEIKVEFSDHRSNPVFVWVEKRHGLLQTTILSEGFPADLGEGEGNAHLFNIHGRRIYESEHAVLMILRKDGQIYVTKNPAVPKMIVSASSPANDIKKIKEDIDNIHKNVALSEEDKRQAILKILNPIIQSLNHDDWRVSEAAAWDLGKIGDSGAVSALMTALENKDANVRGTAAWAIREIRMKKRFASSPLTDIQEAKKAIRSIFKNRDMSPKVQIEQILGILKPMIGETEETQNEELRKIAGELEKRLPDDVWETAVPYLERADITRLEGALDLLSPDKKGGIDLNPGNMDMQTRGADRIQLPMPDIPLESIWIDGLVPVILHVAPVANLPLLLGLKSDGGTDEGSDVFRVIEQQPAEAPRRFPAKEAEQVSALN